MCLCSLNTSKKANKNGFTTSAREREGKGQTSFQSTFELYTEKTLT